MSQKDIPTKFIKKISSKPSKCHSEVARLNISQYEIKNIEKYCSKLETLKNDFLQINKNDLRNFIVIGTVKNQIFCIFHPFLKLYGFVDQHAMHERIRYEYYTKILQGENIQGFIHKNIEKNGQTNKIQVMGQQKCGKLLFICKNVGYLKEGEKITRWGIHLSLNESNQIYMISYHLILGRILEDAVLKNICLEILELHKLKSNKISETLDNFIAEQSCKNAIKFGHQVSQQWCYQLLYNASLCNFPWKCVHGRQSVYLKMTQDNKSWSQMLQEYSLQ